jgi:glycosyltransferase involved in cell wall biosynthesis
VLLNRPLVDLAARRADAIITVSQSAKRDIVRLYGLPPDRVHVVHEAAAPSFRPIDDDHELERVRRLYVLPARFILYVGTIEPRKNLPKLIEAFASRRKSGDLAHQLVCAGPYGWLSHDIEARIDRLQIADAVRFTGYVPFDDLPALYNLAEMFVFPSLYEGFGLPVLEAMASGVPVITGPVPALMEVAGGAVEHVDGLDAESLGDRMVALARDRDRRRELRRLGLERAHSFSWRRAARETLDVYRQTARQAAGAAVLDPAFIP